MNQVKVILAIFFSLISHNKNYLKTIEHIYYIYVSIKRLLSVILIKNVILCM